MAELREIPFTHHFVPGTLNHLLKMQGANHEALGVYLTERKGWDVTCSCDDPIAKGGKSHWFVNGLDHTPVLEKFHAHLSYFDRPKTKAD